MYAAAGGASLASRRKNAKQQVKNKQLQKQGLEAKLAAAQRAASGIVTPTKNQASRQFHNLPSNYLRTPQAQARKLSASYATQSKLLLPIDELNKNGDHHHHHHSLKSPCDTPKHLHHHHHQHHHHRHGHSPHHQHLFKSATATIPLVSQVDATPPGTPTSITTIGCRPPANTPNILDNESMKQEIHIKIPDPQDSIIVTPATPLASPGQHQPADKNQLIRKCSFYRERKLDDPADLARPRTPVLLDKELQDYYRTQFAGMPNGTKYLDPDYCDLEHGPHAGICSCDRLECAQGRAAWQERGRRCSVQDNTASCHRRWVKRNRIHDSSIAGSSDDEDFLSVLRGPSSFANAFLYVGLGTIAIGLVIAFVGTGEKGFRTSELRLIGPSLIGIGFICCVLRILFCICPSHCIKNRRKRNGKVNKVDADHRTSLLHSNSKRVQIARGPNSNPSLKSHASRTRGRHKGVQEGMEALRHLASTSLFIQNEQIKSTTKKSTATTVPVIKEPENQTDKSVEMERIDDVSIEVCSISDMDDEDNSANHGDVESDANSINYKMEVIKDSKVKSNNEDVELNRSNVTKLGRGRTPLNKQKSGNDLLLVEETSLSVPGGGININEKRPSTSPATVTAYPLLTLSQNTQPENPPVKVKPQQHHHHTISIAGGLSSGSPQTTSVGNAIEMQSLSSSNHETELVLSPANLGQ